MKLNERLEIKLVILEGHKAAKIHRKLVMTFGKGTLTESIVLESRMEIGIVKTSEPKE